MIMIYPFPVPQPSFMDPISPKRRYKEKRKLSDAFVAE